MTNDSEPKPLVELVSRELLSDFAIRLLAVETNFSSMRKPNAKSSEYRPEHFDTSGRLTDLGLDYTRGLITTYPIIKDMFNSYLGYKASFNISNAIH